MKIQLKLLETIGVCWNSVDCWDR